MDAKSFSTQAANIAKEKKASRVVLLDLTKHSDLCEFSMICSAQNDRQAKAIAESIEAHFKKEANIKPLAVEGTEISHWILMDYGAAVFHIFMDPLRDYYSLETIWPDAKIITEIANEIAGSGPADAAQ